MSPPVFCRARSGGFFGFSAVILAGYFFCVFAEAWPALLQLVFDDACRQVSESFGELGPEGPECCDCKGKYGGQQFLGRVG